MTDLSLKKDFTAYVTLNVLGMIGISCYILADTFFISNALGALGLAALNFSLPVYNVMHGFGMMFGIGGGTKFTVFKSQCRHENACIIFTHSIILGLITGIIMFLVGRLFSVPLSQLLGADGEVLVITNTYLKTVLFFAPFFVLNNILIAFVRNDKNPKLAMLAMLLGSFANIVLDYIFIYPFGWGMFGAAFATGLSPIISMCILSFHFTRKDNSLRLFSARISNGSKFTTFKPKLQSLDNAKGPEMNLNIFTTTKIITSLGVPAFITELSSGIVLLAFNLIISGISGNVGVAAYGIIANIALVIIAIFTGIAQGTQPLLSRSYGYGEFHHLKKLLKYASGCALAVSFAVYLFSSLNAELLIAIFNSEENILLAQLAHEGIIIYFVGFFFAGINIIATIYFSSVEQPHSSFILALLRGFALIVPMVFILSRIFGLRGVWLSFPATELITTVITFILIFKTAKKSDRK